MAISIVTMVLASTLSLETAAPESHAPRQLASVGCDNCCFRNDCSVAFSQTTPGVCCGAHPYSVRRQTGCCPMGASCVACGNIWKCTQASYVSRSGKCSICRDDQLRECMYNPSYDHYHSSSSFSSMLLLLIIMCALLACLSYGQRDEPDFVVVQGGIPGQYVQGPGGQTVIVQGGCMRYALAPITTGPLIDLLQCAAPY